MGLEETYEYDKYFVSYPKQKISRDTRKQLKLLGFKLQRHTRTNQEIWVYDK